MMAISIVPEIMRGTGNLNDIITFHSSDTPSVFYQEFHVPFSLTIMDIPEDDAKKGVLSVNTPDVELLIPAGAFSTGGRPVNSQHQHNVFEFTYVLEGSMYQIVEGKRYFYPAGGCCLMNRNTLHTEEVTTSFTCMFMTVSAEFVSDILSRSGFMLFPNEKDFRSNLVFSFFGRNLDNNDNDEKDFIDFIPCIPAQSKIGPVQKIFDEMLSVLLNPSDGATFRLTELIMRFIGILCNKEYYDAEHVTANSNNESLLFSRINRILDLHHGRIGNREIAALLNYNGSYIGRIVKKYTGKSLFDYSMTFAMNYAAAQLRDSKKSVSEIASELKFSNRTHFYSVFKKYYGITPREFRLSIGKINSFQQIRP